MSLHPFTCDVAVVGAGPAGALAARVAAAAGLDVLILEKAHLPRYKTCGGGILGRAVRHLHEQNIPVAERECFTTHFNLSPQLRFSVSRAEPIVYMTMRNAFDAWLIEMAVRNGARVRDGCIVHDVVMKPEGIVLTTSKAPIRARYVVAADGAGGLTAKKAGWPDHRKMAPALECEIRVMPKDLDRLSGSARFDFDAVPHGYAWVFPKKAHLSIGVLTLDPKGVNLNDCFERYLHFLCISQPLAIERHGFVIPLEPRAHTFARGGVLLTGDAAGFADPVTAEGISNAILSGRRAGQAIVSAFAQDQAVMEVYDAAIERDVLPELRCARRLARVLYGKQRFRDTLFSWQGRRLTDAMTDLVAGNASYRSLLADPSNYLKLFRANA